MDRLKELDVNIYIVSNDNPDEQAQLYQAIEQEFGESVPFISDQNLELSAYMGMKNGDVAYRGYGLLDSNGKVIFSTINDHWGEQLDKTVVEIKENYEK